MKKTAYRPFRLFVFPTLLSVFILSVSPLHAKPEQTTLVPFKGNVEHVFFHPLIVNPSMAFLPGRRGDYMRDWFVTSYEFKEFLNEIYERGYVLVSLKSLFEEKNGKIIRKQLYFPAGKKPLILSVDDLNYYKTMQTHGVAKRLEIRGGKLFTVIDTPAGEQYLDNHEIITIVDRFVKEHPDFSWNGAKGIIAPTGYKGVFGYNTVPSKKNTDCESERAKAITIAEYLKKDGWEFASHGYWHLQENRCSYQKLEKDITKWKAEVGSIVGPTNVHIYPFGDLIRKDMTKLDLMKNNGFKYFFGVTFVSSLKINDDTVYGNRIPIDGKYLMGHVSGSRTLQFCDIKTVIDPKRVAVYGRNNKKKESPSKIQVSGKASDQVN
ncbi:MAG TPA: polysaccharide deacetylase family protein [Spirochaetota bacterium]|nr:polysaccharide deacetylase family protein [Spirochaetota bacterium]